MRKNNKVNDFSFREMLEKLRITSLQERRNRSDLIGTFKIINDIFNCSRDFLNISSQKLLSEKIL